MSTVVNINPDTSEINITPKKGFEIDLENSDLKNGKVLFKEVIRQHSRGKHREHSYKLRSAKYTG